MSEARAIGIDLGTTYSCVAAFQKGKHDIIKTHTGQNTMASFVSFTNYGRIIGDEAKENSIIYPTETVFGVKRFIGRRFDDTTLQQDLNTYPFDIIDENGNPKIQVQYQGDNKIFWPEEISAMILEKMKENAEKHFGKEVKKAVITVPAHFNDSQRQATKDAGKIAGLEVLRIINEPTAAALAYGIDRKYKGVEKSCNVLIYDFGGGTFDVSIIAIDDGVFEVKATTGDTHLGGDDIDLKLVDHFAKEFKNKYNKDIHTDRRAIRRLRLQCENLKRQLSRTQEATIDIDSLFEGKDFYSAISRPQFESICTELFRKTLHFVQEALTDANMKVNDIDEVILIGGSTRIPKIQEMVRKFFPGININTTLNPDEAVAIGASVQAAILDGTDDEVVGSLLLVDVNSLSLGIEVLGGIMSTIIPRNTQIPTQCEKIYETAHDYQTTIQISVFEGERKKVSENHLLGKFKLTGIKRAKRGQTKIIVTLEINTNGILHVTAVEKDATNNTNSLDIHMEKFRLTEDDIKRIVTEAEAYKRDDAKWEIIAQARHKMSNYCSDTKRRVAEEFSRAMSVEHQQIINLKCDEAMKWIEKHQNETKEEYEKKQKEVYNVCNPIIRQYL